MAETRDERLARIQRALELGMPPLTVADQRWLFEQVPVSWFCKCGEKLDILTDECVECGEELWLQYARLAQPRKRCEKCGGDMCDECNGTGYVDSEKEQ